MARADGRLTADLNPQDHGPQDACGVIGIYAPGEEVSKLTYFGMYALQHRGQESAGMAVSDGRHMMVFKDMGLVSQVFDEATLNSLQGHMAVGHTRYSTTGASIWDNAQPTFRSRQGGDGLALAHNGNLTNTGALEALIAERAPDTEVPHKDRMDSSNDTSLVTALMTTYDGTLEEVAAQVLPHLQGAFSLVFMDDHTLCAARDPQGIRPLVLGRLSSGWVVASETAAIDIVGGTFVREIEPGEMVAIDAAGLRTSRFAAARPKGCVFEYVYLARPDTVIAGRRIHNVRVKVGKILAQEHPADADLVIPVPESGTPAAIGYADESGIPYGMGLVKNSYVGRTFIQPSQPCATWVFGSSSTRCVTSLRDDASSSSMTPSCAAIPSVSWSECCVRLVRPRYTCASLLRRCSGRASTALTSLLALSSSPRVLTSRTSADLSALTRLATSALTASSVPPTLTPITSAGLVLTAFIPYRCLSRREPC